MASRPPPRITETEPSERTGTRSGIGYRRARCFCLVAIVVAVIWSSFCASELSGEHQLPAVYRLFGLEPKLHPPDGPICHHGH